jgi:hypothetical protein
MVQPNAPAEIYQLHILLLQINPQRLKCALGFAEHLDAVFGQQMVNVLWSF